MYFAPQDGYMIGRSHAEAELPVVSMHPSANHIRAVCNFDQSGIGKDYGSFRDSSLFFGYLGVIFPVRGVKTYLFPYLRSGHMGIVTTTVSCLDVQNTIFFKIKSLFNN